MTEEYRGYLKNIEEAVFVEDEVPEKADIIFIPGNGYPHMACRAAELYREGRAPWILPSGRYSITKGAFEKVCEESERYGSSFETEWEFLRKVLLYHGVPEDAILREDHATFTYENAIFSRQVTDGAKIAVKRAILCCKNYHARRALIYYRLLYPETEFFVVPSVADGITRENWMETERGIQMVCGEVERIAKQCSLMLDMK